MYAAMMKSQTSSGELRTIAITPTVDGVRIFSRLGEGRGRAGAWTEGDVLVETDEKVIGSPVSLKITPAEDRIINSTITPSMFLVKLGKKLTNNNITAKSALDEFNTLLEQTMNDPNSLAVYENAVIQIQQVVNPLPVQPVQEVIEQEINEEITMQYAHAVAPTSNSDAVLVVPEVKPYYGRVFNGLTDVQIAEHCQKFQKTLLITGPAGTGKTSFAHHYAATKGLPFVVIEGTRQIDETKVHGRFMPTGIGNNVAWKDSQFLTAIQQPSVILINELSRMPAKAADLFLRVLNERELIVDQLNRVVKVHPDCLFIVDQNTGVGYAVTKQDIALLDRMQPKLEFDYDITLESKFIQSPALLQFANAIRESAQMTDQFTTPMSPRILMDFISNAKYLNLGFAVTSLLNNFPKDDGEREAVKMRLDADIDAIASELGVSLDSYSA
jgi:hypothetical protein